MAALTPPVTPATGDTTGPRLRALRLAKGLSIRELARLSGVTHASISLIERDRHSPSVSSLKRILDCLGVTLSDFFSDQVPASSADRAIFYRADELIELADGQSLSYRQVGAHLKGAAMMILHERYAPGADTGAQPYRHEAEEGGVVVQGRIELTVDGEVRILDTGDAYYFDSRLPHRMRNPFEEECVVISAISPPTF
ncbi:cupin domain-containing protein [Kushneria phosphatilytica]|uniref:Cupin domain-containing protein n=1 Tax=Kushneria phosphatilytica TaxID=657387 RepID=A0A1S1NT32_9GAMM|nr:cupin domain-containing protein [Kushneria phosphatilytica]OHV08640.1 XRE family transcriptional regulator [Kushneria phosphatilytica]QEL12352.1 cupin domain-containing protein [Kushneria phosphatilytica]